MINEMAFYKWVFFLNTKRWPAILSLFMIEAVFLPLCCLPMPESVSS